MLNSNTKIQVLWLMYIIKLQEKADNNLSELVTLSNELFIQVKRAILFKAWQFVHKTIRNCSMCYSAVRSFL